MNIGQSEETAGSIPPSKPPVITSPLEVAPLLLAEKPKAHATCENSIINRKAQRSEGERGSQGPHLSLSGASISSCWYFPLATGAELLAPLILQSQGTYCFIQLLLQLSNGVSLLCQLILGGFQKILQFGGCTPQVAG